LQLLRPSLIIRFGKPNWGFDGFKNQVPKIEIALRLTIILS